MHFHTTRLAYDKVLYILMVLRDRSFDYLHVCYVCLVCTRGYPFMFGQGTKLTVLAKDHALYQALYDDHPYV